MQSQSPQVNLSSQQQGSVENKNNIKLQGEQRFELKRHLANTLQGRIYIAIDKLNDSQVIVKETWKQLVRSSRSREGHRVLEDFHQEKEILNYLSSQPDCNSGFVRILDEWEDEHCFFYAMECCEGGELFEYVKNVHTQLMAKYAFEQQNLPQEILKEPTDWIKLVRDMFRQIVDCVSWMHKKKVCHLDLSLENTMICDTTKQLVKIIDFGLGKHFTDDDFSYDKRVGKTGYMAPEVYAKDTYDARKADIWSLGVMLFMMLVGAPPYEAPNPRNPAFHYIINGHLRTVLQHWKRLRNVTEDALDLMTKMFKCEKERISMDEIRKHPFVQLDSDPSTKNLKSQLEAQMDTKERVDDEVEMEDRNANNNSNRSNDITTITTSHATDDTVGTFVSNSAGSTPVVSNGGHDTNKNKKHQKQQPDTEHFHDVHPPGVSKIDDFKNDNKSSIPKNFDNDTQPYDRLDIRNRKFYSNEANDFRKKILEMENQTNTETWNNFLNELQKIINEKNIKKEQISQQRDPGFDNEFSPEGITNDADVEAQIEKEIEELQSLHKYVVAKAS